MRSAAPVSNPAKRRTSVLFMEHPSLNLDMKSIP